MALGIIWQLYHLELPEPYLRDPENQMDPEELPDGSTILIREIDKALQGEDFSIFPQGETRMRPVPGIEPERWSWWFNVHRYTAKFGLPSGQGWGAEREEVLEYLAHMDDVKTKIEAWRVKRSG